MIWLASFPRSGNTFFRNVLYEVYGIESSTFHMDPNREVDQGFGNYPVVKTHLLPGQLPFPEAKSVYIVRDGRDSLVSIAHHRKDIVEPGTDFYVNLLEAILSPGGSNFGGWKRNVEEWIAKADILIHFEELVQDPIGQVERLRAIMDLPEPDIEKLPSFEKLKMGAPQYGGGKPEQRHLGLAKKHFRKGKRGSWKEEMPPELEEMFWGHCSQLMQQLGYDRQEGYVGNPLPAKALAPDTRQKVLIEATKMFSGHQDGVQRYLTELVGHIREVLPFFPNLEVSLYNRGAIQPLPEPIRNKTEPSVATAEKKPAYQRLEGDFGYETVLLRIKGAIKWLLPRGIYRSLSGLYRQGPFRKLLAGLRSKKVEAVVRVYLEQLESYHLIHVPLPQNMHWVEQIEKPVVVTAHDFTHRLFPEYHTAENIQLAEAGMQAALQRNATYLSISEATARDLIDQYPVRADRIYHTLEGASRGRFNKRAAAAPIDSIQKKYGLLDLPYLLCLSTIEPRKNLVNTVKAFLQMLEQEPEYQYQLVICGRKGWKTEELFADLETDHSQICFTGFVDDEDLPVLYGNARALCYVSHYEGFGLPILEAMSCGTPVVFGNNSSMPQVAGPGGLAADSEDISSICAQMKRMVSDDQLHRELSAAAWRHSNTFSWWKTAFDTLRAYQSILDKQP
jgi:glycosyltransferase involved in cell wall biosynthesis